MSNVNTAIVIGGGIAGPVAAIALPPPITIAVFTFDMVRSPYRHF